jgi:hypothetical protein
LAITGLRRADALSQQLRIRIPVLRVRHPATTLLQSRGHPPGATSPAPASVMVPLAFPRSFLQVAAATSRYIKSSLLAIRFRAVQ